MNADPSTMTICEIRHQMKCAWLLALKSRGTEWRSYWLRVWADLARRVPED